MDILSAYNYSESGVTKVAQCKYYTEKQTVPSIEYCVNVLDTGLTIETEMV